MNPKGKPNKSVDEILTNFKNQVLGRVQGWGYENTKAELSAIVEEIIGEDEFLKPRQTGSKLLIVLISNQLRYEQRERAKSKGLLRKGQE